MNSLENELAAHCGYCNTDIAAVSQQIVACPKCGVLHCVSCAASNEKCTAYGCNTLLPIDKNALQPSSLKMAALVAKDVVYDGLGFGQDVAKGFGLGLVRFNFSGSLNSFPEKDGEIVGHVGYVLTEIGTTLYFGVPWLQSFVHKRSAYPQDPDGCWVFGIFSAVALYGMAKLTTNIILPSTLQSLKSYLSSKYSRIRQQLSLPIDEKQPEEQKALPSIDALLDEVNKQDSLEGVKALISKYKKEG